MNARERMRGLIVDAKMMMIMDAYEAALAESYGEGARAAHHHAMEILRDNYAAAALNGLLACNYEGNGVDVEKYRIRLAERAYEIADSMLAVRNAPKQEKQGATADG
jgi:hypothetical protein